MNMAKTLSICLILCTIFGLSILNNSLDYKIREQRIIAFNNGINMQCGEFTLNKENTHFDGLYFFREDLIGKEIHIDNCVAL